MWIENQLQGGVSGVIDWPGSEKSYAGEKSIYYKTYKDYKIRREEKKVNDRIETMITWLTDKDQPANLLMVYYNALDKFLRENGVHKDDLSDSQIKLADAFVGDFIKRLEKEQIDINKDINVIIIGSHGVYSVGQEGGISLHEFLNDQNICTVNAMGTNAIVTPSQDKFDEVYNILVKNIQTQDVTKYRVYKYDDIPVEWHLKESDLMKNKIFLVAKFGYFFWNSYLRTVQKKYNKKGEYFDANVDGYPLGPEKGRSNSNFMKTIFMAKGPRIEPELEVSEFETIDIYPLLRNLLELPEVEKKYKRVEEMNRAVKCLLRVPPSKQQVPETGEEVRNNVSTKNDNKTVTAKTNKIDFKEMIASVQNIFTKMLNPPS